MLPRTIGVLDAPLLATFPDADPVSAVDEFLAPPQAASETLIAAQIAAARATLVPDLTMHLDAGAEAQRAGVVRSSSGGAKFRRSPAVLAAFRSSVALRIALFGYRRVKTSVCRLIRAPSMTVWSRERV